MTISAMAMNIIKEFPDPQLSKDEVERFKEYLKEKVDLEQKIQEAAISMIFKNCYNNE